jgi:D-3-phosphoglycerate dehydrogenase
MRGVDVVITDCDHPNVDIEGAIFDAAGLAWRLETCRTEEDVIRAGRDASALLVQYVPVTRRVFDALPACRVVARYGVGLDSVDVAAAVEHGVRVVSIPDYCVDEVADHALALILALSRGIVRLDRAVHAGRWDFTAAGELHRTRRRRLGVLGAGKAGRALAGKAAAIGFDVVGHDPYVDETPGLPLVSLDEILSTSDVLSLHLPLSDETHHIIGAEAIEKMRRGTFLVNTSRGGLADVEALVPALLDGRLGGAGLDVLEQEPIARDDPLLELPNVILSPHAAFYSEESIEELNRRVAEEIVATLTASNPMPEEVRR